MEDSKPYYARLAVLTTLFNRQWWWTTLLVLVGIAVLLRLGFWQLDRREQRRAYNADIVAKLALPPLYLNDEDLPAALDDLKHRQAEVHGKYDFSQQVALTQQHWMDRPGFHLITPLVIDGGAVSGDERPAAVLVDRGWLPAAELDKDNWSQYDVSESLAVTGYIKLSQTLPKADSTGTMSNAAQTEWYRVDVAALEAQLPYALLPIFLQQVPPTDGNNSLPYRGELEPDLSDGPHLSYAIQWFIFSAILGVGYVNIVSKRTKVPAGGAQ